MINKLLAALIIPLPVNAGYFIGKQDIGNNSYLDARYLNHSIARFITKDSAKEFKSHYTYGNGRIIVNSDPTGKMLYEEVVTTEQSFSQAQAPIVEEDVYKLKPKEQSTPSKANKSVIVSSPKVGVMSESYKTYYNRAKAKELLSMSRSLEISIGNLYDKHYAGQFTERQRMVRTRSAVSREMTDYVDMRVRKKQGKASLRELTVLDNYYKKLSLNTVENNQAIQDIGEMPMNSKSYTDMLNELIGYFSED